MGETTEQGINMNLRRETKNPNEYMAPEDWFDEGVNANSSGRFEDSVKCFDKAIESSDDTLLIKNSWLFKGYSLERLERVAEAIYCFDKVLEMDTEHGEATARKAYDLFHIGKFKDALIYFDKAIKIKDGDYYYEEGQSTAEIRKDIINMKKCKNIIIEKLEEFQTGNVSTATEIIEDIHEIRRNDETVTPTENIGGKPLDKIKVQDETWIGCALLHYENPKSESFKCREIVERVSRENIYGSLRPGIQIHCNLHNVANREPNPGNYRLLYATSDNKRRLYRDGDDYHPLREGRKTKPDRSEIPDRYHYLIDWYNEIYNRGSIIVGSPGAIKQITAAKLPSEYTTIIKTNADIKTTPVSISRTIYDPAVKNFVFGPGEGGGKALPNIKNWIDDHNPVIYWFILRIDNLTDNDISQWAVELYTHQALSIIEAYIDGIDRCMNLKKRERDAWGDKWLLSIPKQMGIPIVSKGTRRLYFKVDINCKEGLMHQYGISGIFMVQGIKDVEIKEKFFQYSCKVGEFRQIFEHNPDEASEYAKEHLKGRYPPYSIHIFTNSFRMIHDLSRYCHSGSVEQDALLQKLRLLLANFEKVPEITDQRINPLMQNEISKLEVLTDEATDSLISSIMRLCDSIVELLHIGVMRERKKSQEIPKTYTNNNGLKFSLIPTGMFMMGSEENSSEEPVHKVKISKPFYLGTYPITQKEWKSVMGNDPSKFKGDNFPVESVSWDDVQEFIKKLNEKEGANKYRLPTEAEWEYSVRAGTTTRYSFGDDESKLSDYAWYSANSGSKTHDVGQKKPNPWGLYDMHGNVWEWIQDKWHDNYNGAPVDGNSWEDGDSWSRVARGGYWTGGSRNCRSASRSYNEMGTRFSGLGFRLLMVS